MFVLPMKKEEKRIKIFGQADCYGVTKDLSFTLRLTFELDEEIDKDAIEKAVADLEKRFFYLKVSLKHDLKAYYYVPNERPFVVKNSDKAIPINCEESNWHMLSFSYSGKSIYINCFHGQMDGTGIYRVAKALLFYYGRHKYGTDIKMEDVATLDEMIEEEEYRDAYHHYYLTHKHAKFTKAKLQKKRSGVLNLSEAGKVKMGVPTSMRLIVPQKDLMKYCSDNDGSPVTALALMMAEAIRSVHPSSMKKIVIGIPVNLRPAMGLKKSHCSLYDRLRLEYTKELSEMPFEKQGTVCRGTVIRFSDHEILQKSIYRYCRMLATLNAIPLRFLKQWIARIVAKGMKRSETADVTYVGKSCYGDMDSHVKAMYLDLDSYGLGIVALLSAIGDKFFIAIDQDWEDRVYVDAFLSVLSKRGISYEIASFGPLETAKLKNM